MKKRGKRSNARRGTSQSRTLDATVTGNENSATDSSSTVFSFDDLPPKAQRGRLKAVRTDKMVNGADDLIAQAMQTAEEHSFIKSQDSIVEDTVMEMSVPKLAELPEVVQYLNPEEEEEDEGADGGLGCCMVESPVDKKMADTAKTDQKDSGQRVLRTRRRAINYAC